jgi:predicted transcriptional regulator
MFPFSHSLQQIQKNAGFVQSLSGPPGCYFPVVGGIEIMQDQINEKMLQLSYVVTCGSEVLK